jgi:hypothetical protein
MCQVLTTTLDEEGAHGIIGKRLNQLLVQGACHLEVTTDVREKGQLRELVAAQLLG